MSDRTVMAFIAISIVLAWPIVTQDFSNAGAVGHDEDDDASIANNRQRVVAEVEPDYMSRRRIWNRLASLEGEPVYLNVIWSYEWPETNAFARGDRGLTVKTPPGDIAYTEDPQGLYWGPKDSYAADDGGSIAVNRMCRSGEVNHPPPEDGCEHFEVVIAKPANPDQRPLWYEHGFYHLRGLFFVDGVSVEHMMTRTINLVPINPGTD